MIVVDSNVIASLYLPGDFTVDAEKCLRRDPDWAAPILWRSEFRTILALYQRKGLLEFDHAYKIQREAESLMASNEYHVDSYDVLRLADQSGCSAYDCEFVSLALRLGTKLVTMDAKLRKAFPQLAVGLAGK